MFIFITALSRIVTKRGCDISPTQRSVTAKFPNSSFVGEDQGIAKRSCDSKEDIQS